MGSTNPRGPIHRSAGVSLKVGSGQTLDVDADEKTISTGSGKVAIKAAAIKHVLVDGTASATNVTITGMAVGDELVSVHAQATKASVETITDRTSEYAVGAGMLTKAAGTNETNNQLDIWYIDRT